MLLRVVVMVRPLLGLSLGAFVIAVAIQTFVSTQTDVVQQRTIGSYAWPCLKTVSAHLAGLCENLHDFGDLLCFGHSAQS